MKREVKARWGHVILVCEKCSKKVGKRFGSRREKLAKALRRKLSARSGRKSHIGVVEVPCLDVCPKKAVMVVDSRRPGVWRVVRADADLDRLAADLGDPIG